MVRRIGVLVVLAGTLVPVAASSRIAGAAPVTVDCAGLPAALAGAMPGDVITLDDLYPPCTGSYRLKDAVPIVLQGADEFQGFDGSMPPGRVLSGHDVGATVLRNLIFRDSVSSSDGGAVALTGEVTPQVVDVVFIGNSSAGEGGSLLIDQTTTAPPGTIVLSGTVFSDLSSMTNAAEGGGFYIDSFSDVRLSGNILVGNEATSEGGGGWIAMHGAGSSALLSGNVFAGNQVTTTVSGEGGGLWLASTSDVTVTQTGNLFYRNLVRGSSGRGAGEWVENASSPSPIRLWLRLTGDLFRENALTGPFGQGAGLGVSTIGCAFTPSTFIRGANVVAAGNVGLTSTVGGGIYMTGCAVGSLELVDSTVAGNQTGSASMGPGTFGNFFDTLYLTNTIVISNTVTGNPAAPDVAGFGAVASSFSDACTSPGTPYPGTGNICSDPRLVDSSQGDARQTPASPTVDLGSNALVPAGLTADHAGGPRFVDGDGDGSATVDMGADELDVADLALTKVAAPDPVVTGATLTYTLTVANTGSVAAPDVTLTDTLPAGLALTGIAASQGTCSGAAVIACALGTIGPDDQALVRITVIALAPSVITNAAEVRTSGVEPDLIDNSTSVATTVIAADQPPSPVPECPGLTWYLAEGTTRDGFDEYLLVLNTSSETASVSVVYTVDGGPNVTRAHSIGGDRRLTIPVFEPANLGRGKDHGTVVTSDRAVIVERSVYVRANVAGIEVDGDHNALAEAAALTTWHFSEGTSLPDFQTYFTVANPTETDTLVTAVYGMEGGGTVTRTKVLPARSRVTLDANSIAEGVGPGVVGFSTVISATVPVLAERPVYFDHAFPLAGGDVAINGATDAFGVAPSKSWYLAEGTVLPNFAMFLTLGNPGPSPVDAVITYNLEGSSPLARTVTIGAQSRLTVPVFDSAAPGGIGREVSDPVSRGVGVTVTSAQGVVVERALYFAQTFDPGLARVFDGHATAGASGFAKNWSFAEGTGLPDFRVYLTLTNPGDADAAVGITYFPDDASLPVTRPLVVPARQRRTVATHDPTDPGGYAAGKTGFSVSVSSNLPVLAERPFYEVHDFPEIGLVNGGNVSLGLAGLCA